MFVINEDKSIYVTRGDTVVFSVVAEEDEVKHIFKSGDVVRFKVFEKKACENVVIQKDTLVEADMETVEITLDKSDTKIGDVISKPTDYWYEVELNPFTNPQTIIGYDDDGAKVFRLYPEGADRYSIEEPDELPLVDDELDPTSDRPIQNQAVARALVNAVDLIRAEYSDVNLSGYLKKKDVDFDVYVKKTDYATNTEAGVVKVGGDSAGVKLTADKMLVVASAGVSEIQKMESANRPITPYYLKYAIKTGLSKNDLGWTEEEKAKSREVIGAAGLSEVNDMMNDFELKGVNNLDFNNLEDGYYFFDGATISNGLSGWSAGFAFQKTYTTYDKKNIEQFVLSYGNGLYTRRCWYDSWGDWELKLGQTDVVDNLVSTATNLPVSANQARILDEKKVDNFSSATLYFINLDDYGALIYNNATGNILFRYVDDSGEFGFANIKDIHKYTFKETANIVLKSGWTLESGSLEIKKVGKQCFVSAMVVGSGSTTGSVIATLPDASYRPSAQICIPVTVNANPSVHGAVTIFSSSNDIHFYAPDTTKRSYWLTLSYMTA